jgi:hypothetical protein
VGVGVSNCPTPYPAGAPKIGFPGFAPRKQYGAVGASRFAKVAQIALVKRNVGRKPVRDIGPHVIKQFGLRWVFGPNADRKWRLDNAIVRPLDLAIAPEKAGERDRPPIHSWGRHGVGAASRYLEVFTLNALIDRLQKRY